MVKIVKPQFWTPDEPVLGLPVPVRKHFSSEANILHLDLLENRPHVILIPAPRQMFEGHMIRVPIAHNPEWYSQLYHSLFHFRRDRSLASLERIRDLRDEPFNPDSDNRFQGYKYDSIYRELIRDRLVLGYSRQDEEIGPVRSVVRYFAPELAESMADDLRLTGEVPF